MKTAWAFPGQGTEDLDLARILFRGYPVARETFGEADRLMAPSLSSAVFDRSTDLLALPRYSHLAIFTLSVSLQRILRGRGHAPQLVMGHSMGEVAALVAAGALPFERAFHFLERRAEMMERLTPPGTGSMAAVHDLDLPVVGRLCGEACRPGELVQVASLNAENQIVVAGNRGALQRVLSMAEEIGGGVVPLEINVPVHCDLMRPVSEALEEEYGRGWIVAPAVPFISSVTGEVVKTGARAEELLHAQLHRPILWSASVRTAIVEMGIEKVIEVGPGRALLGLFKRIDRGIARVHAEELLD